MHKHPAAGFGLSYVCTDREGWRVCVCACVLFFFFCGAANFLLMGKRFRWHPAYRKTYQAMRFDTVEYRSRAGQRPWGLSNKGEGNCGAVADAYSALLSAETTG